MYAGKIVETGDVKSVLQRSKHPYIVGTNSASHAEPGWTCRSMQQVRNLFIIGCDDANMSRRQVLIVTEAANGQISKLLSISTFVFGTEGLTNIIHNHEIVASGRIKQWIKIYGMSCC